MVRIKYDVIVVGAGSAGLTAARIIFTSGFRVASLPIRFIYRLLQSKPIKISEYFSAGGGI